MPLTSTALCLAALAFLASACSSPPTSQTSLSVPPATDFAAVSVVLEANCGTLDCHGATARNFRVYGHYGLRLYSTDVSGGADTRDEEVQATYESLVTIDPETLSRVFQGGGASAEQWVGISKARGLQRHKGGVRLAAGSRGDSCLVSWVTGSVDVQSCLSDDFGPIPLPGQAW